GAEKTEDANQWGMMPGTEETEDAKLRGMIPEGQRNGSALEDAARNYLNICRQELRNLTRQHTARRQELLSLLKEKEVLGQKLPLWEQQFLRIQQEKEDADRNRIQYHARLEAALQQKEDMKKQLMYGTYAEAQRAVQELQKRRSQITEEIETAKEQTERCRRSILAEQKALETLKKQAEQRDTETLEGLNMRREELTAQKTVLEQRQKQRHVLLQTNEGILTRLQKSQARMTRISEEYQTLAALSDTANGELKGRQKLAFEQYIQAVFFNQIIHEANKRFSVMTEGRYLLKRRESAGNLRSQMGLDLDVFDYYTGRLRNVQSLSGGEAFKASLSLALGLADVVQRHAGGVQLDAIFIDEGFGSLDRESLNQAIKILNELAGSSRLAGIISHVEELKERIDRKIVVKKGTSGSTLMLSC
ncbi:MAG: SbcC/MukB-like Walker B domain-containing protein, partial [Lachnospiraceae bacterium]|nr:SbcC/MukB-like Walker B domain-containing protein [Lachnospiraceae bacterium]